MTNPNASNNADSAQGAPLQGLRVLEFGQYIAVPAATQLLADLGAEVIKVEPPAGDSARWVGWSRDDCGPMFTAYNRGKRSVVLDLRSEEARAQALALALRADVVVNNMRPGIMARLGLDAARLMALSPRLVVGQVSGFGQDGPASVRPGYDVAAQAESGMMSMNGDPDRVPTRVGYTVVDATAARTLATGVLAALVRRGVTGRGGLVDLSLVDVAIEALSNAWAEMHLYGSVPKRRGNGQPTVAPAGEVIPTADGMVVMSAYTKEHFPRLCAAIDLPNLPDDPRFAASDDRVRNRAALLALLAQAVQHMTSVEVCRRLTEAGVVVGVVRSLDQVQAGQHGVSADLFVPVDSAGRPPVPVPGLPFRLDGMPRRGGHVPGLGEHTAQVLAELSR